MFEKAVAHFGHLDIVVSNSGVESFGHISEITPEECDRVFAVNTRGQLFVAQQAYKHLTVGGKLVMLSSISAQAKGVANHAIYSGSKGAVEAFARCLAVGENCPCSFSRLFRPLVLVSCLQRWLIGYLFLDFGPKRINVNSIAPGGIRTDMYVEAARKYIPNQASMTDQQIDEVSLSSVFGHCFC